MEETSILDKIITQRHVEEIRAFDPVQVTATIFADLTDRERNVLSKRYGVPLGVKPATLEQIGAELAVTRERIRQIANASLLKIREVAVKNVDIIHFLRTVEHLLRSYGGALEESFFVQELLSGNQAALSKSELSRAEHCLRFLLDDVLVDAIECTAADDRLRALYALRAADKTLLRQAVAELVDTVTAAGRPITAEQFLDNFRETAFYRAEQDRLVCEPVRFTRQMAGAAVLDAPITKEEEREVLLAYVSSANAIAKNIFGEWGLADWPTVRPRRMNDKIYLVLKHEGKPLHFGEISRRVNAAGFDLKVAKPPSVHNELILDKRFVLVGRGTYALREWGFRPGTVSDVIVAILNGAGSLTREAIVEEVLKRRFVKRQTIHLALLNRKIFQKTEDGRYLSVTLKSK